MTSRNIKPLLKSTLFTQKTKNHSHFLSDDYFKQHDFSTPTCNAYRQVSQSQKNLILLSVHYFLKALSNPHKTSL